MTLTLSSDIHACDPEVLIEKAVFSGHQRILLLGQPGIGKTSLAASLAAELSARGRPVRCLGADPGSPGFGVPGAACLGEWKDGGWSLIEVEGLCTLDAARFRLPLVSAVGKLAAASGDGMLLLDAPGVVRGVAGAELLDALVRAAVIDLVLVLQREGQALPLAQELSTLAVEAVPVRASDQAHRPGKMTRARNRTSLWDQYLGASEAHQLIVERLQFVGTPPRNAPEAWQGKQVAFLQGDRTLAMGEVMSADGEMLEIRLPIDIKPTHALLVRDACRNEEGLLDTSKPFAGDVVRYLPPADILTDTVVDRSGGLRPLVHTGTAIATLMNGVLGDPLLHLRLSNRRRSLLFDLGDGARLPTRIAHQVSDVFITHTHVDHISGFLWFLRSRIGEQSSCRLFGPPGLCGNIRGLIDGIHWDRIGDRGPRFEINEIDGDRLRKFQLQAGVAGYMMLGEEVLRETALLSEPEFSVHAATLDHGTPVLAFSYEPSLQINVRNERLIQRQLQPGPWLNELKQRMLTGDRTASIRLPNGQLERVSSLAEDLTLKTAGKKVVYATDFADTPENRCKLQALAQGAHTLFCEATFLEREAAQARRTGHLTTRACGEIARNADVQHLIPFHFSRRYEDRPWQVYEEISPFCPQVVIPKLSRETSH